MEKTARITNMALCAYRTILEANFAEHMTTAKKLNKDNGAYDEDGYVIAMHKALTTATEYQDVNDMLGGEYISDKVWDRDLIDMMLPRFTACAEAAYERSEARIEDLALTDFHSRAYGDDYGFQM